MRTTLLLGCAVWTLAASQATAADGKPSIAAAVEANLRTMATQCGSAEFAQRFNQVSRALIERRERTGQQGEAKHMEAEIEKAAQTNQLNGLYTPQRCANLMPDLKLLYDRRLQSLAGNDQ